MGVWKEFLVKYKVQYLLNGVYRVFFLILSLLLISERVVLRKYKSLLSQFPSPPTIIVLVSILGTLILNRFPSLHWLLESPQPVVGFLPASAGWLSFYICWAGDSSVRSFAFFFFSHPTLTFLSASITPLNLILFQYLFARHHKSFYSVGSKYI